MKVHNYANSQRLNFNYTLKNMTTTTARQKLITYLADAEESKVNALFTLLESDIEDQQNFSLSEEQLAFLELEHDRHVSGESASYTRMEAKEIIRGNRDF
jgi:hypothetical protein